MFLFVSSGKMRDTLERMRVDNDSPVAVMQNYMLDEVLKHRDALGFPMGGNNIPAFFVTSDVSKKYGTWARLMSGLMTNKEGAIDVFRSLHRGMELYMATYDDPDVTCDRDGCCALHHSLSKEAAEGVMKIWDEVQV